MQTIHISTMSGKLKGLRSISTNTLTNPYCIKQSACGDNDNICTKCYSVNMLSTFRKNTAPALQRNSDLLASRVLSDREIPFNQLMTEFCDDYDSSDNCEEFAVVWKEYHGELQIEQIYNHETGS